MIRPTDLEKIKKIQQSRNESCFLCVKYGRTEEENKKNDNGWKRNKDEKNLEYE